MLQLKNIVKTYVSGEMRVEALGGVSLEFRKNDFVSILGPSGCGKTTMLNIIGGLDRYTSGDLVIGGISTKEYSDVDWDIYRNNSIGFVFQSYNLISHQTVYTNIELALTLAGISRAERHRRVVEVLEKVGLKDQIYKKPTQMSGGQMQRVAIARALVNNPEILLADEPTGALDSETSIQIMELLKEISKDRLVIMVTHNDEIARKYSTRIIKLLDGKVIHDSNPFSSEQEAEEKESSKTRKMRKRKKISMSFMTALALSFKNLLTKKTRTILTAFAGSIGIIGIALILSLSSGMQAYVNSLERDTLSSYPIVLEQKSTDLSSMMALLMENNKKEDEQRELDKIYSNNIMTSMIENMVSQVKKNDLKQFKNYLENEGKESFAELTNSIQYGYNVDLQVFKPDTVNITQINPSKILDDLGMNRSNMSMGMSFGSTEIWSEMLDNQELLNSQFDIVAGNWPQAFDEIVLIMDENNELNDVVLYSLGLLDQNEFEKLMNAARKGEEYNLSNSDATFSYDDILSLKYKLVLNTDYYVKENGGWTDLREDNLHMKKIIENAQDLKVVGIIKPAENAAATTIDGAIGYTSALTDFVISEISKTEIAKEQLANPETNILEGIPFDVESFVEDFTMEDVMAYISGRTEEEQMQFKAMISKMKEEDILSMFTERIKSENKSTLEDNFKTLGIADLENPSVIRLFPTGFEAKGKLETLIADYNKAKEAAGKEELVINYTDMVKVMTSSISDIINIISYVLIAFVAISLVVSSIMISIITYISVLERTKEIGILRSIGASKRDITRVFNAETVIEGLVAGAIGILITMLLNIPINAIIKSLAGISGVANLPVYGAVGLIVISIVLTVVAGFIPSKMAAKKDPVAALRTE